MKFESFKSWCKKLFESEEERYGCAMLLADIPNWKSHLMMIRKEDIYDDAEHNYGYADEPHITLLYGIHQDEVDLDEVFEIFKNIEPISVVIDTISIFENDENYDVVKYDVPVSEQLKEYREMFKQFPNTQTFEGYHPHITISYVKKGEGKKYVKRITPFKVNFNKAFYSSPDYDKKYFELEHVKAYQY